MFVLNNGKDNLGKFDSKSDEGIFLGYSSNSKAFRIYNKRTMIIEESIHVIFYEMQSYHARTLDRRLQVDWARDAREGPKVLMSLRADFGPVG